MFYTVFSTNDTPYMQWQSDLLEYSWKKVEQEGVLVRLVATNTPDSLPPQKYAHCVSARLWDVHPETGDFYPIYNKPASLLEWLFRDRPEGTVLLLDPDCVFRKPVTRRVAPGYPASQKWIGLTTEHPNKDRPFGFGEGFSFLNDHCAKVDLGTEAIMIPTLIHTSDLRKVCARWLQLCGIIRQNYRDSEGSQAWESDMFAYVAACAEYGLHHDPASLGICTNWQPDDCPDAPIIHYCQPILAKDGEEIFFKQTYKPWERIDASKEAEQDYGHDLVATINAFVDESTGATGKQTPDSRPKWRDTVIEGRVIDELLLEVPSEHRSVWLNGAGKAIWELCDGSHTIDEIEAKLAERFSVADRDVAADVSATVGQLHSAGFLEIR